MHKLMDYVKYFCKDDTILIGYNNNAYTLDEYIREMDRLAGDEMDDAYDKMDACLDTLDYSIFKKPHLTILIPHLA